MEGILVSLIFIFLLAVFILTHYLWFLKYRFFLRRSKPISVDNGFMFYIINWYFFVFRAALTTGLFHLSKERTLELEKLKQRINKLQGIWYLALGTLLVLAFWITKLE